jgi:hypothetical protein
MKAKKLLLVIFLSVLIPFYFFTSCTDDELEPYSKVLAIASEIVEEDEGNAYWVKVDGSSTWQMMHTPIANFDHEEGYEYTVEVSVKKIKDPGADQSSNQYTLVRIISKEKKDSEVPLFTTDISSLNLKSQDELAFPNTTREVITLSNGMKIEKIDSLYIYQGDIVLNEEQLEYLFNTSSLKSSVTTNSIKYWHNNKVYYQFANDFTLQQNVYDAIQEWETKTSLSFEQSTGNGDYIEFFHGDGNYSNSLGMKGGKQLISLSETGSNTGTAIHEIGHAVGLIHEQCRNDRDNSIIILWDNIDPDYTSQFELYPAGEVQDIGNFDFTSVMLYSSNAFSVNGNETMETIDGYSFIGQRSYLSSADVEGVKSMYGPPYTNETQTVTVINQYVSGMDDYYEYDSNYTIYFYSTKAYTQHSLLIYPRNITYIEETHTCDYYGDDIHVSRTYKHVLVPAGAYSYNLGTVRNIEYYVNSNPSLIDKTLYYVIK